MYNLISQEATMSINVYGAGITRALTSYVIPLERTRVDLTHVVLNQIRHDCILVRPVTSIPRNAHNRSYPTSFSALIQCCTARERH